MIPEQYIEVGSCCSSIGYSSGVRIGEVGWNLDVWGWGRWYVEGFEPFPIQWSFFNPNYVKWRISPSRELDPEHPRFRSFEEATKKTKVGLYRDVKRGKYCFNNIQSMEELLNKTCLKGLEQVAAEIYKFPKKMVVREVARCFKRNLSPSAMNRLAEISLLLAGTSDEVFLTPPFN